MADFSPRAIPRERLLYVEDQEINVLVMQALVALRPALRLSVAMNGEDALRVAAREPFDLLLLDLRLPDCHGTELLQRLRELPGLHAVPAVAVTADVSIDLPGTGFLELWPKPLHVPDTLRALDRLTLAETTPASAGIRAEHELRRSLARGRALVA
jgi:CheY-like chemotaxis protein